MSPKKKVRKKPKSQSRPAKNTAKKSKTASPKKKIGKKPRRTKPARRATRTPNEVLVIKKGPDARSAGQGGDLQGLSGEESVGTESVEELLEDGQSFEAAFVSGVENAPDPDESEVTTKEVPEDDIPPEYLEND